MPLRTVTLAVAMDEPCLRLMEYVRPAYVPGRGTLDHRYCQIVVLRDGKPVEYVEDLGLAKQFVGEGFLLPGGLPPVETVGSLLDYAHKLRDMKPARWRMGFEYPNLPEQYRMQGEERWKQARRESVFGFAFRKQRDG